MAVAGVCSSVHGRVSVELVAGSHVTEQARKTQQVEPVYGYGIGVGIRRSGGGS